MGHHSGPGTPSAGVDIESVRAEAMTCTKCRLARGRTNVVWADGSLDADLLFIGEAPGFHEDKQGLPFVGAAGQLLDKLLAGIGLDRTQAAIVNVLKCRPPNNRDPQPDEIESCRPYLRAQLEHMRPKVIVTLGNFATRFVLEQPIGITRARGRVYKRWDASVIPTFHPAAALRGGSFGGISTMDALRDDFQVIKGALAAARRPSPGEPVRAAGPTTAPGTPAKEPTSSESVDAGEQLGLF